nr:uncharacterized protein LOC124816702 [Hydra vulgaris]
MSFDINHILIIQKVWRGYKVRKKLFETRNEFISIVKHIDNTVGKKSNVFFPYYSLCMPSFQKESYFENNDDGGIYENSKTLAQCGKKNFEDKNETNKNMKQFEFNIQHSSSPLKETFLKNIPLSSGNVLSDSWLSNKSFNKENGTTAVEDTSTLSREDLCLEIMWINQAINSRKNYLKLKNDQIYK